MTPLQTCYSLVAKLVGWLGLLFFARVFPVQQTTNSLLLRNRESARKCLKFGTTRRLRSPKLAAISAFTLYLRCKPTAKETGSHMTAHTTMLLSRRRSIVFAKVRRGLHYPCK
jgi:hypothetical protein